ncbi:MAG: hypothetical protein K8I60_10080, partial [Anaerolineae bacterium]|nr:hypothetical protein [Anaerolineae bacterium]
KMLLVGSLVALLFFGFLFTRLLGGSSSEPAEVTPELRLTPTPEVSPTPTPLALEDQDEVIQGGDSGRTVAYPVNLQVMLTDGTAPRLWVVQRRRVAASEWNFDPNPDTASFVSGMSVRPVIGIPWSDENAAFFERIGAGTDFLLTLNTGAALRFVFDDKRDVRRGETGIFRQVGPGLVLLLIGETGADGLPTATRMLVTATYPPDQELARDGQVIGTNTPLQEGRVGNTLAVGEAAVTLRDARLVSDSPDLPPDMQALLLDVDVMAGTEPLDTRTWRVELVDAAGAVYPLSSGLAGDSALPADVPPLASLPASLAYLVPGSLTSGRWLVTAADGNGAAFVLTFAPPPVAQPYDGVDVRLVSVTHVEGQITTHLRIYNGRAETLRFTPDDIWLALGYAADPPGPRNPAEGLTPFDLLPEQAVDLALVWYWGGEPYASLGVGAWRFAVQVVR